MDQQQIVENNRLIAEFMGVNPTVGVPQISYHTSWNQLMPVVGKIEQGLFFVSIKENGCSIHGYRQYGNISFMSKKHDEPKIQAVYNAVIAFINWYNSNK